MHNEEKNLNIAIRYATKWSVITNIMRKLITPITNMVLARLLTPDAFGIVATINMVISFADLFTDAGFQKYLVQHEFENREQLENSSNVAFWTNFILSIILWLIIVLFCEPLASIVGSSGYGIHLAIASLSIPLLSFSSIQQALFRRDFNYKGMFGARLVNSLIPIVITIPLAYFLQNCWALIVGTLIGHLTDAVILTYKSKWRPRLYYSVWELRKMLSFTVWTMIETFSIWLTTNIDIFILGQLISSYYLGLYKTSLTSVSQITNLITATVIPVLFAALSRSQHNEQQFKELFFAYLDKCAFILIPMSIGIFLYSDIVTWILLGEQWMEASNFVGLIGLLQAFIILFANFASEVYRAKGEPQISLALQFIYICIIIPCLIWGANQSFEVLCIMRILVKIIFIIMQVTTLKIRYAFRISSMVMMIMQPLIASLGMALVGYPLHEKSHTITDKLLSIIVCIAVYGGLCLLFPRTRKTLSSLISNLINIIKRKINNI